MMNESKPTNLLYLITDLRFGGAQTVLLYLLEYLDRSRFSPQVACLYGGDSPLARELIGMGIPVTDFQMTRFWRLDALGRLYDYLRREKITILHASLFHANIAARIIGKLAKIPVILTWRQNVSIGGKWRDVVNRLTARLDDRVVAVSEPARRAELSTTHVSKDKVKLIYNCIDLKKYSFPKPNIRASIRDELGIPKDAVVIGFVGRLHPQKWVDGLLRAFSKVEASNDVRLLILGEGELREQLQALAKSLPGSDRITFAGTRSDIPNVLASMDIFALPSLWEGLPLALLEAMASQLPVVVTPVGGVPDVVVDGETGLIVPVKDEDALASVLNKLVGDSELRIRMGEAGRQRVQERFSAQEISKQLADVYERLLREKTAA